MTHFLYVIIGASGSGKDTVADKLGSKYGLKKVRSWTTRSQRPDPKDELSHCFGSVEDYKAAESAGHIIAKTLYNGSYYWATREQADLSDIYIADMNGWYELNETYIHRPLKLIHLAADAKIRKKRMEQRGDSLTKIAARIDFDQTAFADVDFMADVVIRNDGDKTVDEVADEVYSYITKCEESVRNGVSTECISCKTVGADENGVYCGREKNKIRLLKTLEPIMKGYSRTDTVPISGSVIYDLYMYISGGSNERDF